MSSHQIKLGLIAFTVLSMNIKSFAADPKVYWKNAVIDLNVPPTGYQGTSQVEINHIMEWQEEVVKYRSGFEWVYENSTCEEFVCSKGSGQSQTWNNFYAAKTDKKAGILAEAIKGIGEKTAQNLIDSGYFKSKPRSWGEFSSVISQAANSGALPKNLRYEVLVTYKNDNATQLGYSLTDCYTKTIRCEKPVWKAVSIPYKELESFSKTIETKYRKVQVNVQNPKLQDFETEHIQLEIGAEQNDVRLATLPQYTRYQKLQVSGSSNETLVDLQGESRIAVDLPYSVLKSHRYQKEGGKNVLTVQVDPKFIPADSSSQDKLVLVYQLETRKRGFFAAIGGMFGGWEKGQTQEQVITDPTIKITVPTPSNKLGKIQFQLKRVNSSFYNSSLTSSVETDKL